MTPDGNMKDGDDGSYADRDSAEAEDMAKKLASDDIISAYLAYRIKWQHKEGGPETYRAMARRYGVSHAHLNNVANHRAKAEETVVKPHARMYFAGSLDSLHAAALQWFESNPEAIQRRKAPPWIEAVRILRTHRMFPALLMGLDEGMDVDFLKKFADAEHSLGDALSSAQWWTKLQAEYSEYTIRRSDSVRAAAIDVMMPSEAEAPRTPRKLPPKK